MRLFIATPVKFLGYSSLKDKLSSYIRGKWVEGWNLHLTHKFIGDDDACKYKIDLNLPKEEINVNGIGVFNNILYLKANSKNINYVANKFNNNRFFPHITLCRIKEYKDKDKFFQELKNIKVDFKIPFEVYLYNSTLTKKGPIYEKIFKYK